MSLFRGSRLVPSLEWPNVGSRWPTYNLESSQADGLLAWWTTCATQNWKSLRDPVGGDIARFPGGGADPSWTVDVELGQVLDFSGSGGEHLQSGTNTVLAPPVTFVARGYIRSTAAYDGIMYSRGTHVLGMHLSNNATQLAYTWDSDHFSWAGGPAITTGVLGVWAFVLASVSQAILYQVTASGVTSGIRASSHTASQTLDDLRLGQDEFGDARTIDGRFDDFRLYDKALNSIDLESIFDYRTRWHLHQIPRRVWAVEAAVARRIFITHC